VIETNLRGAFLTCRAAARSMTAGGRPGKLITISSGAYASGRLGASHRWRGHAVVDAELNTARVFLHNWPRSTPLPGCLERGVSSPCLIRRKVVS
jgi:NAD(P)-dependent dehydrogenase (short-subunit alcohol dehydrogenase family)